MICWSWRLVSTKAGSCCPLCFCPATRCHSHYARVVADLPCAGLRVQLILHVRRFFCDHTDCIRKIFTERLPAFVLPWARLTVRLGFALQSLGLATCGELGTRLAARLALQTSPTTILRRIMVLPTAAVERVSELGRDDFSCRRGRKFGTILVDMQSHQTIDLLPDRKQETAAAWMSAHPEIDEGSSGSRRRLCFCGGQWCSPSHPVCGQVPRVETSWRSPGGIAGTSSGSVSDPPN